MANKKPPTKCERLGVDILLCKNCFDLYCRALYAAKASKTATIKLTLQTQDRIISTPCRNASCASSAPVASRNMATGDIPTTSMTNPTAQIMIAANAIRVRTDETADDFGGFAKRSAIARSSRSLLYMTDATVAMVKNIKIFPQSEIIP